MAMNLEYELHIRANAGNETAVEFLRAQRRAFNTLVRAGIIKELPKQITEKESVPTSYLAKFPEPNFDIEATEEMIKDPDQLEPLLFEALKPYLKDPTFYRPAVQGYNTLRRWTWWRWDGTRTIQYEAHQDKNMEVLLSLSQQDLISTRNIGDKVAAVVFHALQPLREKFVKE